MSSVGIRRFLWGMMLAPALTSAILPAAMAAAGPDHDKAIAKIRATPAYKVALAEFDREHDDWVRNIITLTEIPAPLRKEEVRARAYADMFRTLGLSDVAIDEEGNVTGLRRGTARPGGPLLVVSAHMDTTFPEGTPTKVRREGDRLYAPGVGDDSSGLATQVSLVNAMSVAGIRSASDILFVGTVGEEGLGNLRGVRYLFAKSAYKDRIKAFISIDQASPVQFVTGGAGSKRYRVTFNGPGGHSSGAFGLVNPMTAMSQVVVDLYKVPVPAKPKTSYCACIVSGGVSVNAIPRSVYQEFDLRSDSAEELARLDTRFTDIVRQAVDGENAARSTADGPVTYQMEVIGFRPAGRTPETADIVQYATAAYKAEGLTPQYKIGSTDSNIAMSLGIPAITFPRAASGDRGHSVDEWTGIEKADNLRIKAMLLATVLALAGQE